MDSLTSRAYMFARRKHKNQQYNERAFILHPMQVSKIIKLLCPLDYELQCAAILHDVLEDTDTTLLELNENFGGVIAGLVYEVTKTDSNTFPNLKSKRGIILKFADRLSNLTNIHSWDEKRQADYLKKSKFWQS